MKIQQTSSCLDPHETAIVDYGSVALMRAAAVARWHIGRAEARKNLMPSESVGVPALKALELALIDIDLSWSDSHAADYWRRFQIEPAEIENLHGAWRAARDGSERDISASVFSEWDAAGPIGQAIEIEEGSLSPLIQAFAEIQDCRWQAHAGHMSLIEARMLAAEILAFAPGLPPMNREQQQDFMRSIR